MLFQIKVLVSAITLVSFTVTADVIVQPGYEKVPSQPSPVHSQFLVTPSGKQQDSEFGHTRAQAIPTYAHGHQGGVPYQVGYPLLHYPHYSHYPHYPHYPHYVHTWPRYAPQRHLRVLKIGGHKVYQPSWFVGHRSVPLAVHHRYKKSIGSQPDCRQSRDTVPNTENSPLNTFRSDMTESEGNNVISDQSKNDHAPTRTLFDLNPSFYMNKKDLETKLNLANERNAEENNALSTKEPKSNTDESSSLKQMQSDTHVNSEISPDKPNLGNFPDPRPYPPQHKSTTKPLPKDSQEKNPILGSPITGDKVFGAKPVQPEYPMLPAYNYNYEPLLYSNYAPAQPNYLPVYVIRYGACNDGTSKMYGDQQQPAVQGQNHQTDAIHETVSPPDMGFTFSRQPYNYVRSNDFGYPWISHYASPPYPVPYA